MNNCFITNRTYNILYSNATNEIYNKYFNNIFFYQVFLNEKLKELETFQYFIRNELS